MRADDLAHLLGLVPIETIPSHELLAYEPPRISLDVVDAVMVYAFGHRVAADGAITAGPVNAALATMPTELLASVAQVVGDGSSEPD